MYHASYEKQKEYKHKNFVQEYLQSVYSESTIFIMSPASSASVLN